MYTDTSPDRLGPWTCVLTGKLSDARNVIDVPVIVYPLAEPVITKYAMFEINSFLQKRRWITIFGSILSKC